MGKWEEYQAFIVKSIAVELTDYFDQSFKNKSFGNKKWDNRQIDIKGSLMMNTGTLRRSIKYTITGTTIRWTSNLPYAQIQNEGGKIKVTAKMKKFFWAKYKELTGKIKKGKNGKPLKSSLGVSKVAGYYKAMALKKVGSIIEIPQRQFIGFNNDTKKIVEDNIKEAMKPVIDAIMRRKK